MKDANLVLPLSGFSICCIYRFNIIDWGVKMAVWEDAELASPCNQGTCRPLVGGSDAQRDGRNPKVNQQDAGGLRGEEKWRPGNIGAPEAGEIRRGRWEGLCGKSRRCRQEGLSGKERSGGQPPWPLGHRQPAELPSQYPTLQSPLQAVWVPGGIKGGRGDQERQAGGALPDQRSRRGKEGICSIHLSPGSLLGSQVRCHAV